ncbi:uncharacterized protein TNCV_3541371 [Trichonephila clavipes]|nr:uncharacterized protein TNCV_3541371 [Trichonephila clavipes]
MSLCGMKFHACCTCWVKTGNDECWFWMMLSSRQMISRKCSIGDRYGIGQIDVQYYNQCFGENPESVLAVIGNCLPDHDSWCRSSVPSSIWLYALPWPPFDQHAAITSTKAETAFIRKHNKSPLRFPMSFGLTLLALQTAMAWLALAMAIGFTT